MMRKRDHKYRGIREELLFKGNFFLSVDVEEGNKVKYTKRHISYL